MTDLYQIYRTTSQRYKRTPCDNFKEMAALAKHMVFGELDRYEIIDIGNAILKLEQVEKLSNIRVSQGKKIINAVKNNNYEIKIDELITNNYKLEYHFNPFNNINFPSHIIKEDLGNLFNIISVEQDISDNNIIEKNSIENNTYEIIGDYKYIKQFYNSFNCYENEIIINIYYGDIYKFPYKTFVSKKYCYILRLKETINNINIDYIYNYLYNNKNLLCLIFNNYKKIYKINLKKLPIPLISLEGQNTIVNNIKINKDIIKTLNNTITNLQYSNSQVFNELTNMNII